MKTILAERISPGKIFSDDDWLGLVVNGAGDNSMHAIIPCPDLNEPANVLVMHGGREVTLRWKSIRDSGSTKLESPDELQARAFPPPLDIKE